MNCELEKNISNINDSRVVVVVAAVAGWETQSNFLRCWSG